MTTTGLLFDTYFSEHRTEPGHPESPERIEAIRKGLAPLKGLETVPRREATLEEVAMCHDPRYVEKVLQIIAAGETDLAGGDVSVDVESGKVALNAVGGMLNATDLVIEGKLGNAFCAVRPPGHHARPAAAMGFCLFNTVAVAARHAQKKHGLERVAIIDWDVHHGNGTQEIFYEDGSVLYFSTHQSPWYPGTGHASEQGEGEGEGLTINRPLRAGSGGAEVLRAVDEAFLPKLGEFRPDLILISAGFDSRAGDPLGYFRLTDEDFRTLTERMLDAAARLCEGRLVSVLEGGYSLSGLAAATHAHVKALCGK